MSMTILQEMQAAAGRAPILLGDGAEFVAEFLSESINEDGGGLDRAGGSDLYYTVFVLQGMRALGVETPTEKVRGYLRGFGDGKGLDLVHLACLARCWTLIDPAGINATRREQILERIERCRRSVGGYTASEYAGNGTIYHSFMALGAYQDLGAETPDAEGLLACVDALAAPDGGYANEPELPMGTTPATAAAAVLMRHLGREAPESLTDWLRARRQADGGFLAMPQAPGPDLLSTATAVHALRTAGVSFGESREMCLDYLDTLWTGRAFCGSAGDATEDSEYTYYALLALGHLGDEA